MPPAATVVMFAADKTAPDEKALLMDAKKLVVTATTELFGARDPAAIDRWFSPNYVQHSPLAPDGVDSLRSMVQQLPAEFSYVPARAIADGDLVALHGTYHGFGPEPLVAFDIFQVADDRIVAHWDALQPVASETASGRSQVDGPTEIDPSADTESSRAVVSAFAKQVLIGADYGVLTDYLLPDYHQHNPEAADGIAGFGAAAQRWATDGKHLTYQVVHRVIAEGDFVLTQSEGDFGGPVAYFDLFRIAAGKIVEHWDVIAPIPAEIKHSNGIF